jgi:hypothetical protein
MEAAGNLWGRLRGQKKPTLTTQKADKKEPTGTYIQKLDADSLSKDLNGSIPFQIWVWRSVNVRFLRAVFHDILGGRLWLKLLYWWEERFPHYFGKVGQYPMIVIWKK